MIFSVSSLWYLELKKDAYLNWIKKKTKKEDEDQ